jgi:TRAP transporter 4TM/12TM fusion protein
MSTAEPLAAAGGDVRTPPSFASGTTLMLPLFLAGFHLYLAQSATIQSLMVQNVHLGVSIALVGLSVAAGGRGAARAWGLLVAAMGIAIMVYIGIEFDRLLSAQGYPRWYDVIVGIVLIAVVFEATRLRWGLVLPVLALVTLAYYVFGHHLPATWGAPATPLPTIVSNLAIGMYSGVFGTFMSISANDVFLFMVFGGLLEMLDGNRPFTEIGKSISRRLPGGAGLTTVVSSGLMGMVTGAAVSNVAICGTYTIPWMKRDGYPPETAAAIEATASTGGQLMPPVMGSVAFIMAALLAVPYWDIVVSAVMPAIFFYVSVFAAVFFASRRLGIPRKPMGADIVQLLFYLPLFVVPLAIMTMLLAQLRSVAYAACWAIVSLVVLRLAMVLIARALPPAPRRRLHPDGLPPLSAALRDYLHKLRAGLSTGVMQGASMAVVMGTVGVLSECVTATGVAVPMGWAVEAISGSSLFLALLSTAVMCLILGAGIPTVGAYVLTAAIAGPIIIGQGLDQYAAHFFILYYACLSAITPPVAAAALAASAIAGTSYFRTAQAATLIAAMLYFLPFLFVYEPALLASNMPGFGPMAGLLLEVTAICIAVSAASQGFLLAPLGVALRIALWAGALALALHVCGAGLAWLGGGIAMVATVVGIQRWRPAPAAAAGDPN